MGMMIDDDVKKKLLDSLAEEPSMVISTAYAYAKNYVLYGEDITKEWTTAVQQASIIEKVSLNAWAQAHETFRKEYETRLKADMVAILEEIQTEIEQLPITDTAIRLVDEIFDKYKSEVRLRNEENKTLFG